MLYSVMEVSLKLINCRESMKQTQNIVACMLSAWEATTSKNGIVSDIIFSSLKCLHVKERNGFWNGS